MNSSLLWVVAVVIYSSFCHGVCLNEEGTALLSFMNYTQGDPGGLFHNWNSSDLNPCSWTGVTCSSSKVVSLTIPKKKLTGRLSPSVGSLSFLRHINLRSNRLDGGLPVEIFDLQNLQSLVLGGNSFSGSIPPDIDRLNSIQILDLSRNSLNGSVPSSLLKCKRLRFLDFSSNNFTGSLPEGFGSILVLLEKLNLSNNSLSGKIPSDMGNLAHLQGTLDLSRNKFSGHIPQGLGRLPENVYIDLSYNNLTGQIPQSGALVNRGPTAFTGNPGLCGPPLKNLCSNTSHTSFSFNSTPSGLPIANRERNGLNKGVIIGIIAGDILGIALIGLIFFYYYWRLVTRVSKQRGGERTDFFCFGTEDSDTLSESVEQFDLVALDSEITFDLDELLKASAFVLGKSKIGIVYKVVLDSGLTLAVRRLGDGGLHRFKEFRNEVEAVGKLKHPNIVTLRAYYWSPDEKLLIYDFIPNENLTTALHRKPSSFAMSWAVRVKIMKGIAKGLAYLHEFSPKKYIHGDLRPSNILLKADMEPCISDFGLSRLADIAGAITESERMPLEKQHNQLSEGSGKFGPELGYQAPETLHDLKPSQSWDVYSFGVILLEIITGQSPGVLLSTMNMTMARWIQLCIEERKPLAEVVDADLVDEVTNEEEVVTVLKIALTCVQSNPERRPLMRHVSDGLDRMYATLTQ